MKKIMLTLGLLSLISQPVLAQGLTATPVPTTGYSTGAATPIIGTTPQAVTIPKKHWWQQNTTGYVCPSSQSVTGGAAPAGCFGATGGSAPISGSTVQPVLIPKKYFWGSNKVEMMQVSPYGTTGGAAPVLGQAPVSGQNCGCGTTGGAAETTPQRPMNVCPMKTPTGGAAGVPRPMHKKMMMRKEIIKHRMQKAVKTGGAAPVRGYW